MFNRHTVITTILLAMFASLAQARTRPGTDTAHTSDDQAEFAASSALQAAVLDDGALQAMEVLGAAEDEIVMLWVTDTGCEFELSFTPGADVEVLHGEDETCDFAEWLENSTTYVEATEVVSVWESDGWFEFFAHLAGESGSPGSGGGGNDAHDGNDYTSAEQREDLDDCSSAIIWGALGAIACGGSIAVAVGSTGATAGVLGGSIAVAVATCGMAGMLGLNVAEECGEDFRHLLLLDSVLWQDFLEVVMIEDLHLYVQVEDLDVIHDEVESLAGEWWVDENALFAVEAVSTLHDDIFTDY